MSKAKKLKSGSWRCLVYSHNETVAGKSVRRYRSFTGPTKAAAEMAASKFINDKARYKRSDLTVLEAVEAYIDLKAPVLSPSTIVGYRRSLKYLGSLGSVLVDKLTNKTLQEWLNSLTTRLSVKTCRNTLSLVLSAVAGQSERNFKVVTPPRPPVEYHVPTSDDVKVLLAESDGYLKRAILLAAVGTLRRGEISALKYSDIDRDAGTIYVHADMIVNGDKEWIYKPTPKTSSSVRVIPLPAAVLEALGTGAKDDYVVPIVPDTISRQFIKLRTRLGLKCRFHDLRHYAASILHAIGVPDQYIMERGGWKTDGTLQSIYRNTLTDQSKKYNDKANDYFSKSLL